MNTIVLKIKGMHCTSCAIDIDGELEDTEGVKESNTSYAKQLTKVTFEPEKISDEKIISIVKNVGYDVQVTED